MIESGLSQLSILEANGWSRRSLPVCLVYSVKAALKITSKLDGVEVVLKVSDMGPGNRDVRRCCGETLWWMGGRRKKGAQPFAESALSPVYGYIDAR